MTSSIFFFLFIPILAFILLAINFIFAPHNPYQEKNGAFECGFTSFLGQNRTQFSISFFIFALLFLLFDLEILLVYPYLVSSYINESYGLVLLLIFLLALTLGFVFELGKKALTIESRQNINFNNINTHTSLTKSSIFKFKTYKKLIKIKRSVYGSFKKVRNSEITKKIIKILVNSTAVIFVIRPLVTCLLDLDIEHNILHRYILHIISAVTLLCLVDYGIFNFILKFIVFLTSYTSWGETIRMNVNTEKRVDKRTYNKGQSFEGVGHSSKMPKIDYEGKNNPPMNPADAPPPFIPNPQEVRHLPWNQNPPVPNKTCIIGEELRDKALNATTGIDEVCDCKRITWKNNDLFGFRKYHVNLVWQTVFNQSLDNDTKGRLLLLVKPDIKEAKEFNPFMNLVEQFEKEKKITQQEKKLITNAVYRAIQTQTYKDGRHY